MIQIKVDVEEKTGDSNGKALHESENGGITIFSDTEETGKKIINSGKIV